MKSDCYKKSGQGEPVVMLHSSMGSKRQWKDLAETLSSRYQTIALDLTGYGAADFPADPEGYSLKDETAHVDRLLSEAGLDETSPVHMIGHSFGGATALHWCFHNQERVKSLQVFEPVAFHLLPKDSKAFEEICDVVKKLDEYVAQHDMEKACAHFIDYWSGKGAYASFPENIQQAMVQQVNKVILDFHALIGSKLTLDDYAAFDFPITLIKGTQSPNSSQTVSRLLKATLKNVDFHEVECGHMGPITHSALVNEIFVKTL
ncbi:MAG: alpha/beta hydrolase [Methylocystaceae bacterium]|nr:alpha/beta hydrolase [Methylocystaceae bacterium]